MTLARGLSEPEAQSLRTELNRRGIAVSTARDGQTYRLEVADSAVARAVSALSATKPRELSAEPHAWVTTRSAALQARERSLSEQLARGLERLPGVEHASVVLTLQAPHDTLHDLLGAEPQPRARAMVAITRAADRTVDEASARAWLCRTVPELSPERVELTVSPGPAACTPCAELVHLGAVTLTNDSLGTLKGWLGASLLMHMLGALTLLYMTRRNQKRQH